MIELLFVFFFAAVLVLGAFKLLLALLVLPLKLGLWMVKGLVGLLLFVPAVLFSLWVLSWVMPVALAVVAVPIALFVALLLGAACLIF
jgi:hypothetical protein